MMYRLDSYTQRIKERVLDGFPLVLLIFSVSALITHYQIDKTHHYIVGAVIAALVYLSSFKIKLVKEAKILMIITPFIIGFLKEVVDLLFLKGEFGVADLVFTTIPGMIMYLLLKTD